MEQSIYPTKVNKDSVIGNVFDSSLYKCTFFELFEGISLLPLPFLLKDCPSRNDNIGELAIQLQNLGENFLSYKIINLPRCFYVYLRAWKEGVYP
jgi:hypothetical protein